MVLGEVLGFGLWVDIGFVAQSFLEVAFGHCDFNNDSAGWVMWTMSSGKFRFQALGFGF